MPTRTITREVELATLASEVLSTLPQKNTAHVIALSGELGAGKTTFTKALARELGVTEHITSPTFVVMKSYVVFGHEWIQKLVHIDAYRVESVDEMRVLDLRGLVEAAGTIICIEWPEHIKELIPDDARWIRITVGDGEERTIIYDS